MFITDMQQRMQQFASENATTLLTVGGVVGTVATGVLSVRAGIKAQQIIAEQELMRSINNSHAELEATGDPSMEDVKLSKTEKVKAVWPQFVPPVATGGLTIAAIVMSHRMSAQKAAALAAAYGLSRQQFEEYRAKVAEKLTGPKQEQVDSELAQERANRTPGADRIVIVEGGDQLCFDEATGRYFKSTMEKINRAVNKTNEEIIHGEYCTANFFYDRLGLPTTTWGEEVGWDRDNLVDLEINVILSPEDESTPCISINFKKMPDSYYIRKAFEGSHGM